MKTIEIDGKHYLISEIKNRCREVEKDFVIESHMRILIDNKVYVSNFSTSEKSDIFSW